MGVRNLPKVFTRQRPGGESNRVSTIRKSDALPVNHRAHYTPHLDLMFHTVQNVTIQLSHWSKTNV